ncbi:lipase family alpha/beta hydrolase [Pseudonocardia sp. GCM10023141]|uniref:lipase family alpha/beta hydrolase n=1 Tax=Pseudonocardia sp. GCM10023141 TaxID=3252653 RepID=UPI00361BC000
MAVPMTFPRPSRWLLGLEAPRATWEFGWFAAWAPAALLAPRGDGHTVLLLPGFMADDSSTAALRMVLRALGYDARGWGLGRNLGPTAPVVEGLVALVERGYAESGRPVSLVGVSLGGVFAREMARRHPERVRQVITLASPFRLPPRYSGPHDTHASSLYRSLGPMHEPQTVRTDAPLTVPTTAVYTRTDGIVPWESCLDEEGPTSENVEVWGSHCGIGHNPFALRVITDRLAQPAGSWAPYRAEKEN